MKELQKSIRKLKERENAVILAHNYQRPEIQDIADFLGDSLGLARKSTQTDADYIVFCGVDFMAEGAVMLNPDKTVLIPDATARCPMAAMLSAEDVRRAKEKHPDAAVVLYVNTLAEAKAEADVVCTSANAPQVVNALDEDTILFGPDTNLAYFTQKRTGKEIIPIPEDGYCVVHKKLISIEQIRELKIKHPDAVVMVHPEVDPEIQDAADVIASTGGMLKTAGESDAREFIVGTEEGMTYRLSKENPGKTFHPIETAICGNMKKHTLENLYECLKNKKPVVTVDPEISEKAALALKRMLEITERD